MSAEQTPLILDPAAHEWRGHLYALLGLAYYREPSGAFLQALAAEGPFSRPGFPCPNEQVAAGLHLLCASLKPFAAAAPDRELERLQEEHLRLFTGPGLPQTPPWESVYRTEEKLLFSEFTLEVRELYRRFGLVSEHRYQEPDDHIGLELEFMAHLCGLGAEDLARGDPGSLATSLGAQRDFLDRHLLVWAPQFCQSVVCHTETDFFAGWARLTEGFLTWDREFLEVWITDCETFGARDRT